MDNKDIAKEWFQVAETDLSSAEFLQNMRPVPFEIICFHCQPSAEKFLKGFLALKNEVIRKTHDLLLLNRICGQYEEDFKSIEAACLILVDFSVAVRYPFPMEINENDMILALQSAHKIKAFVLRKV